MAPMFDNLPYDLSANELITLIKLQFPGVLHGRDFWCAHPVQNGEIERCGSAAIVAWSVKDTPQPTPDEIVAMSERYANELAAYRLTERQLALRDGVNAERDRRIANGASFNVGDGLAVKVTGSDRDMVILQAKKGEAEAKKAAGDESASIVFRDGDNQNLMLTPDQMISLVDQGTLWVQSVMQVSWAMKDASEPFLDGIPDDYTDDKYWPPVSVG